MEEAFLAAQLRERCVWAHAEIHTAASWGACRWASVSLRVPVCLCVDILHRVSVGPFQHFAS